MTVGTINAKPTISRDTLAYVDKQASLDAGSNDILLKADSTSTITSSVTEVSIGLVTVSAMKLGGTISSDTEAYIEEGAVVKGADLTLEADSENTLTSYLFYVGVSGITAAVGTSDAIINANTRAFIGPRDGATLSGEENRTDVDVTGDVIVRANADDDANAEIEGGSGSIIANGQNMKPTAAVNGDVESYIGQNAKVSATNLTLTTEDSTTNADTQRSADADVVSGGVGGLGSGSNVEAVATIDGEVQVFIAGGAEIDTTSGTTTLQADSISVADAFAHGGNGSIGISVSLFSATARIGDASNGATKAWIEDNADVVAGNLKVAASADNTATTDLLAVSVGLLGGGGNATSNATVNAGTEAYIAGADISVSGTIGIETVSATEANSKIRSGSGGIGVGAMDSTATANSLGATRSYIGNGATIDDASQINIKAKVLGSSANANVVVGTGAAISVGLSRAEANSRPTAEAYIGSNVIIGQGLAIGGIDIYAEGRGEADANAQASGGGVLQVGISNAIADYDPTVNAYIGSGTTIAATGNVSVNALLDSNPAANVPVPSDEITAVDSVQNTISFSFPVSDGDVVRYAVADNVSSIGGGLVAGRDYNVLVNSQNASIRLGNQFNAVNAVNADTDIITFTAAHNFKNGDAVIYNPGSETTIIKAGQGVTAGQTLYVRLIKIGTDSNNQPIYDDFKIRLAKTPFQASQTDDQLLSTIAVNTTTDKLTMGRLGQFARGQALTFVAQDVKTFNKDYVDVTASATYEVKTPDGQSYDPAIFISNDVTRNQTPSSPNYLDVIHSDTNKIFIAAHGYQTGDKVVYRNNGVAGDNINGLTDKQGYVVIKRSDNELQLTSTYVKITAGMETEVDTDPGSGETLVSEITLANHGLTNGKELTVLDGATKYYVVNATANTFRLSASVGGAAINFGAFPAGAIRRHPVFGYFGGQRSEHLLPGKRHPGPGQWQYLLCLQCGWHNIPA